MKLNSKDTEEKMKFIKENGLGILLCFCIAVPSWLIGKTFPIIGGAVIAILIGMLITVFWKSKSRFEKGIKFTSKKYYSGQLYCLDLV